MEVKVPWWMKLGQCVEETISLQVFCNASANAYATCIFLPVEVHYEVLVRFVQSLISLTSEERNDSMS